jgi:hypothetical protein
MGYMGYGQLGKNLPSKVGSLNAKLVSQTPWVANDLITAFCDNPLISSRDARRRTCSCPLSRRIPKI